MISCRKFLFLVEPFIFRGDILKVQYLMIPVSDEKRQRLNYVCNKLGITIEHFFNTALRESEMGILSNEALDPGGSFWNDDEQTFKKDAE